MINVNDEIYNIFHENGINAVYMHPNGFSGMPVISYFCVSEKPGFCCDNSELIQDFTVQTDIWAENHLECDVLSDRVGSIMSKNGYHHIISEDIPENADGIYHKAMRFIKQFILREENE